MIWALQNEVSSHHLDNVHGNMLPMVVRKPEKQHQGLQHGQVCSSLQRIAKLRPEGRACNHA